MTARKKSGKGRRPPGRVPPSVLDLVRRGVERFVLKDATMMSFQMTIRAASRKGDAWPHPLTRAIFRRIVRKAVQERKRRIRRAAGEALFPAGKDAP